MQLRDYISDSEVFKNALFNELEKLPFGSLPKNELELIIIHSIVSSIDGGYSEIHKHTLELQHLLKISKTQIKNKVLQAQLRFDQIDENKIKAHLKYKIENKQFIQSKDYLTFEMHNPLLNEGVKSFFEKNEVISDTSFNNSIIKVGCIGFIKLMVLLEILSDKQIQEIEDLFIKENPNLNKTSLNKILNIGIESVPSIIEIINIIYEKI